MTLTQTLYLRVTHLSRLIARGEMEINGERYAILSNYEVNENIFLF